MNQVAAARLFRSCSEVLKFVTVISLIIRYKSFEINPMSKRLFCYPARNVVLPSIG